MTSVVSDVPPPPQSKRPRAALTQPASSTATGGLMPPPDGRRSSRGSHPNPDNAQYVDVLHSLADPAASLPLVQPSTLLLELVNDVAMSRLGTPPEAIPPEVIIAFDVYLARGCMLRKFVRSGPPHSRFFRLQFLDISTAMSGHLSDGERIASGTPHAVCCWSRTKHSRSLHRYYPLRDLVAVCPGGEDHPYVRQRQSRPGFIDMGLSWLKREYVRDEFILQLHFQSGYEMTEDFIAVQAPDLAVYLAWQVVGDFFSRLGSDGSL